MMKLLMRNSALAIIGVIMTLAACTSTDRVANQNLSFLYDSRSSSLEPDFRIVHQNDTVSLLDMRLLSDQLRYEQNLSSGFFSAEFRLRYELYSGPESKTVLDSAVVIFRDSVEKPTGRSIEATFRLRPSKLPLSMLKVDLVDLRSNTRAVRFITIDRSGPNVAQFFDVSTVADSTPLFRSHLANDEQVIIKHVSGTRNATVHLYKEEFPLPRPPFSVGEARPFSYVPDSVFTIALGRPVSFGAKGLYQIRLDDSTRQGITLLRFGDGFPKVNDVDDLIAPLRFINSNQEFKKLTSADFPKAEVDRFWLGLAGNSERARILIAKFYGRVQEANTYFTSYTEGWRTDRGMVFLIYGPPDVVYRSGNAEQWTYGDPMGQRSVSFVFRKTGNPFTDNDYRLERSQMYKSDWFRAVDLWRQGRVYLGN
jgi:GWxTD domain-containing protein